MVLTARKWHCQSYWAVESAQNKIGVDSCFKRREKVLRYTFSFSGRKMVLYHFSFISKKKGEKKNTKPWTFALFSLKDFLKNQTICSSPRRWHTLLAFSKRTMWSSVWEWRSFHTFLHGDILNMTNMHGKHMNHTCCHLGVIGFSTFGQGGTCGSTSP